MASSGPLAVPTTAAQAPLMAAPALCARLDCSAILVPILLGVLLSCMALGSLFTLAGRCWQAFPDSRWRSKRALVALVLALQCAQTAFDMARVISIFAVNFGDLSYFLTPRVEDAGAPFIGVFIQLQTQCFFLHRAYSYASVAHVPRLLKWAFTSLILLCILGSAAMGCGVALEIKLLGSFVRLVPGSNHSELYNEMVLAWLYLGAAVDSIVFLVIAHQLFKAKRATHGSIKSRELRQVIKRMVRILVEAGIILVIAQASTAIIWQVEALSDGREKSSWVYLALLILPKVYTFTYYGMLLTSPSALTSRHSSRLRAPSPTSHVDHYHHNIVETIEYDWGKESMSNPSSSEGVITVTGLPLDASPHYNLASTYQPPFTEPSRPRSLKILPRTLTTVSECSTPPASPTPFLGRSSSGLERPTFPPVQRTPPRSLRSKSSSQSRSPPTSPLRTSFRPHAEVPDDIIEEAEESVEGGASVPGGTSALLELLEDEDDQKTLASYRFGSQQHFGSEQRGSSFIDLGSTVIPSPSSSVFGQVIYSRKGSNATAVSSSTDSDGGRKESDASWACADAKSLTT